MFVFSSFCFSFSNLSFSELSCFKCFMLGIVFFWCFFFRIIFFSCLLSEIVFVYVYVFKNFTLPNCSFQICFVFFQNCPFFRFHKVAYLPWNSSCYNLVLSIQYITYIMYIYIYLPWFAWTTNTPHQPLIYVVASIQCLCILLHCTGACSVLARVYGHVV